MITSSVITFSLIAPYYSASRHIVLQRQSPYSLTAPYYSASRHLVLQRHIFLFLFVIQLAHTNANIKVCFPDKKYWKKLALMSTYSIIKIYNDAILHTVVSVHCTLYSVQCTV